MNNITINKNSVERKLYNNQPVISFKDIDLVHERVSGTARRNFYKNQKHFIENEDYYLVTIENAKCTNFVHSNIPPKGQYFFTESGYLMLVKSFTDDLAWEVQRQLVNSYFRLKEQVYEQLELDTYKIEEKTYKNDPVMVVKDIEYMTGYDRSTINAYIRDNKLGVLLEGYDLDEFKYENKDYRGVTRAINILYRDDVVDILDYFYSFRDNKAIIDEYFDVLENASQMTSFSVFTKLVYLGMLKHATNTYGLNDKMKRELNYIISKEYVKLGFADNTMDNFDIHTKEGLDLLVKMGKWSKKLG